MEKQEMQEVIIPEACATLKYARISARKVKIVIDLIRGKSVDEALATVKFTPKAASEIIEKLLKSAIANAENNHNMTHDKLYVAEVFANQIFPARQKRCEICCKSRNNICQYQRYTCSKLCCARFSDCR